MGEWQLIHEFEKAIWVNKKNESYFQLKEVLQEYLEYPARIHFSVEIVSQYLPIFKSLYPNQKWVHACLTSLSTIRTAEDAPKNDYPEGYAHTSEKAGVGNFLFSVHYIWLAAKYIDRSSEYCDDAIKHSILARLIYHTQSTFSLTYDPKTRWLIDDKNPDIDSKWDYMMSSEILELRKRIWLDLLSRIKARIE